MVDFSTGVYFWCEQDIYSPPFRKMIFISLLRHIVIWLLSCPFWFNSPRFCIYFTLLLLIFPFSSPFLGFLSPFLIFFNIFHLFFFLFHIFPPNDISWYPPPPLGGLGYFPKYTVAPGYRLSDEDFIHIMGHKKSSRVCDLCVWPGTGAKTELGLCLTVSAPCGSGSCFFLTQSTSIFNLYLLYPSPFFHFWSLFLPPLFILSLPSPRHHLIKFHLIPWLLGFVNDPLHCNICC